MNPISPILQPVTLGGLRLKNRFVMAPMTRSRADEAGVPPDYAADYYAQRAGAGLIVTEASWPARCRWRRRRSGRMARSACTTA